MSQIVKGLEEATNQVLETYFKGEIPQSYKHGSNISLRSNLFWSMHADEFICMSDRDKESAEGQDGLIGRLMMPLVDHDGLTIAVLNESPEYLDNNEAKEVFVVLDGAKRGKDIK